MLAEGFVKTAEIEEGSSEYEIRNAYSRVYYAMFHVCCAWLFSVGVDVRKVESVKDDHGRLHSEMQHRMGKHFGRLLRGSYALRLASDYKPEWLVPSAAVVQQELKRARAQFYWLFHATRRGLG